MLWWCCRMKKTNADFPFGILHILLEGHLRLSVFIRLIYQKPSVPNNREKEKIAITRLFPHIAIFMLGIFNTYFFIVLRNYLAVCNWSGNALPTVSFDTTVLLRILLYITFRNLLSGYLYTDTKYLTIEFIG